MCCSTGLAAFVDNRPLRFAEKYTKKTVIVLIACVLSTNYAHEDQHSPMIALVTIRNTAAPCNPGLRVVLCLHHARASELVRLRGSFCQTASATGRLAMEEPNLQTVPKPRTFSVAATQAHTPPPGQPPERRDQEAKIRWGPCPLH